MATPYRTPPKERAKFLAQPRPDIDREALREEINRRYENTLRYLGR